MEKINPTMLFFSKSDMLILKHYCKLKETMVCLDQMVCLNVIC